jgi:outer membrane protein W
MSKKTSLLMAFLALTLTASMAQAAPHFSIGVNGGLSLPTGDFGDETLLDAKSGFLIGGCIDYQFNDMFTVGVEGAFMSNKHGIEGTTTDLSPPAGDFVTYDKAKFTTIPVLLHGMYWLPMKDSKLHPYGLLGLGIYSVKYKEEGHGVLLGTPFTYTSESDPKSKFGGKLGLGGEWMASEMVGVSLGANYNFITLDKADNESSPGANDGPSSLQFADVTLGLHWHMAASK